MASFCSRRERNKGRYKVECSGATAFEQLQADKRQATPPLNMRSDDVGLKGWAVKTVKLSRVHKGQRIREAVRAVHPD